MRSGKALSRERAKGRKAEGSFVRLPSHLIQSSNFRLLSAMAVKVFVALLSQYNGYNNGALALPRSQLQQYGFGKSGAAVSNAIKELLARGFVITTRPGGYEAGVALYAVTSEPLDPDPRHGLGPTHRASNDWQRLEPSPKQATTRSPERQSA